MSGTAPPELAEAAGSSPLAPAEAPKVNWGGDGTGAALVKAGCADCGAVEPGDGDGDGDGAASAAAPMPNVNRGLGGGDVAALLAPLENAAADDAMESDVVLRKVGPEEEDAAAAAAADD